MKQVKRKPLFLIGDFETSVYDGQTKTEVWASAVVEMYSEDIKIFHSINDTWKHLKSFKRNVTIYYHNLKFDGSFWLSYLLKDLGFTLALIHNSDYEYDVSFMDKDDMPNNSIIYGISDMGQWYSITVKTGGNYIEFRDSLKLLPFSVKRIGESFGTKHKKLDMEYKGYRYAGCEITDEEQKYIANDVLVVKEGLEIMFDEGHKKLTIGSCCLSEYKKLINKDYYESLFPDIYNIELEELIYGHKNAGEYIRKSYKGGWCYVVKDKTDKIYHNGTTADVNSLYPSMMHSESGNYYPIGEPRFWKGNFIPDYAKWNDVINQPRYYFVRFKCKFKIKDGYLPFIQIKGTRLYQSNESLTTSDVYDFKTNRYYDKYINFDGEVVDVKPTLTLTMTDYELFCEHYNIYDLEILDGCYFESRIGIFDIYIDKYKKIKQENKGAKRELAKLFLNNLYGKMASNTDSSFKLAYEREDGSIGFIPIIEHKKKAGYIPVGSAITSYARNFTIRSAQKNYYGKDKRGFIYADTDSIHCDLEPNEIKGIKIHPKDFCCWKLESCWDEGIFTRQKTYIEHVIKEDLEECKPYYNVKCAGMPQRCKDIFIEGLKNNLYKLTDFKIGLKLDGKLMPKRIDGGTVLVETTFEMR